MYANDTFGAVKMRFCRFIWSSSFSM